MVHSSEDGSRAAPDQTKSGVLPPREVFDGIARGVDFKLTEAQGMEAPEGMTPVHLKVGSRVIEGVMDSEVFASQATRELSNANLKLDVDSSRAQIGPKGLKQCLIIILNEHDQPIELFPVYVSEPVYNGMLGAFKETPEK